MNLRVHWMPAALLVLGLIGTRYVDGHRRMPLRATLEDVIPNEMEGFAGRNLRLTNEEADVAGVTTYLLRNYTQRTDGKIRGFSVYVGYYERQGQGKTIHSPKNCLPGSGWEPLTSTRIAIQTPNGPVQVNRYLLQRGSKRALVLYWYQGRGRVQADEYLVKRDLLRDAAIMRRSEEALVRVTVPIEDKDINADRLATRVAGMLIPAADRALPL